MKTSHETVVIYLKKGVEDVGLRNEIKKLASGKLSIFFTENPFLMDLSTALLSQARSEEIDE